MGQRPPPIVASRSTIEAQKASNRNALPHFRSFSPHRDRLTSLLIDGVASEAGLRLCVLGAGNCYDLDLARLAEHYREIHLVDIDETALQHAWERQPPDVRARVFRHAPVDLSALLDKIERWQAMAVEPQELIDYPATAAARIAGRLPGPFDVVLSACLLTQLQLAVLHVLTDSHRLFEPVRQILNLAHLRTLAALTVPGGRAILATDLMSNQSYPLQDVDPGRDLKSLMAEQMRAGRVIHAARPDLLESMIRDDPLLAQTIERSRLLDAWLWRNGPTQVLLVYALELRRKEVCQLPGRTGEQENQMPLGQPSRAVPKATSSIHALPEDP